MKMITINTELGPFTVSNELANKWARYNTWPKTPRLRQMMNAGLDSVGEIDEYGRVVADIEEDAEDVTTYADATEDE